MEPIKPNPQKVVARGRLEYDCPDTKEGLLSYWVHDVSYKISMPPIPSIVQEKVALLDMMGVKNTLRGVGKKQSPYVYYIHFNMQELKQMESEHEKQEAEARGSFAGRRTTEVS